MLRRRIISAGEGPVGLIEAGSGSPVVLIHGLLTTALDWTFGPMERLARGRRVIAVDRPGHGVSVRPRYDAAPARQAERLARALEADGVERPLLVGHSFGGLVALAWAARRPVAGLVLAAPAVFPEPRLVEQLWLAPRAAPLAGPLLTSAAAASADPLMLESVRTLMFHPQRPPPRADRAEEEALVLRPQAMLASGEDASVLLPGSPAAAVDFSAVDAPAAVIWGEADAVVAPARHAIPAARRLKAVTRAVPGGGHMVHRVAPEALEAAIDAVMAEA